MKILSKIFLVICGLLAFATTAFAQTVVPVGRGAKAHVIYWPETREAFFVENLVGLVNRALDAGNVTSPT